MAKPFLTNKRPFRKHLTPIPAIPVDRTNVSPTSLFSQRIQSFITYLRWATEHGSKELHYIPCDTFEVEILNILISRGIITLRTTKSHNPVYHLLYNKDHNLGTIAAQSA